MSTSHIFCGLNYNYHLCVFFENKVDSYLKSLLANKPTKKLRNLILVYQQNLFHIQELQKLTYDKSVKSRSNVLDKKVWFNGKYIKIEQNQMFKAKFFGLIQVFLSSE